MLAAKLEADYYKYLLNRFNQGWISDRIDDRIPLGFQQGFAERMQTDARHDMWGGSRRMLQPGKLNPLALPNSDPQVGLIKCLVLTQGGVEIRQVHLLFLENLN